MRGADGGPWRRLCALPALWVGLLYDETALSACEDLIRGWTHEEHEQLRAEVPRHGLKTPFRNADVRALAQRVLEIAEVGLKARARYDPYGDDETRFLGVLHEIVERGTSPAEWKLEAYHGRWNGDLGHLYREYEY
jgi:glutamate--cysteine ligase